MRKFDKDGLSLCTLQGNVFVSSFEKEKCSSDIFVRRFMNSEVAQEFDSLAILDETLSIEEILKNIEEEFGDSSYGKTKYEKEVLFWMGYLYRYFAYTYNLSSKRVYKVIKPKELNEAYYVYHAYDLSKAIEEILEEKGVSFDPEKQNERLLEMLRTYLYENNVRVQKETNLTASKMKEKDTFYCAIYREKQIGVIQMEKGKNKTGKLKINLNEESPKNKEMEGAIVNKAIEQIKKDGSVHSLFVEIPKEDEKRIQLFKKIGFQYQDENSISAYYLKELN